MYHATREKVEWLNETLSRQTDNIDMTKTFNSVFLRAVAQRFVDVLFIPYDKAIEIATNINIDSQEMVETSSDRVVVEELGFLFGELIIKYTRSFFDDQSYDIGVMKNVASKMTVNL